VNGRAGLRGPGWPNGPPSPRLAPGGFYGKGDWLRAKRGAGTLFQPEDTRNTGSRGAGPCQSSRRWETERSPEGEARFPTSERKAGCLQRASGEMARACPEPARGEPRRASGRQDACSERPARWHGPAPSPREVNPNQRPAVPPQGVASHQGSLGGEGVWGRLVVNDCSGLRGPGWPNGPPSPRLAPGGFYCVNARPPGSSPRPHSFPSVVSGRDGGGRAVGGFARSR